ncbi:MAG: 4Fe-4S cluster-binding domain-containing protein [Acidimicrobiales bacterium]
MRLFLSRLHYPVTVLGYGRRAGIWFQGCSVRCPGCVSRDTWDRRPGSRTDTDAVLDWVRGLPADEVDGVTISGGEPFDQPAALGSLLDGLWEWRAGLDRPVDVLCYSGRSLDRLRDHHRRLLDKLDCLIPEPFESENPPVDSLTGSGNQAVICLSDLAHRRYQDRPDPGPRVQVAVDDTAIWYIGIPRPGDMDLVADAMARRGVLQEQVSWRS